MIIDSSLRQASFLSNAYIETVLRNDPRKHCLGRVLKDNHNFVYCGTKDHVGNLFSQSDSILIFYSQSRAFVRSIPIGNQPYNNVHFNF